MIERREISRETVDAILRLNVRDDQPGLVASNAVTLAQVAYEQPGSYVWGLWNRDTPVGLIAMINPREYPWPDEGDDLGAAYVWRLMIHGTLQGKGFGRAAIDQAMAVARLWDLPRLSLTCVDKPGSALRFYENLGFARTGRIVDGEVELVRPI